MAVWVCLHEQGGTGMNILIVDADTVLGHRIQEVFRAAGHSTLLHRRQSTPVATESDATWIVTPELDASALRQIEEKGSMDRWVFNLRVIDEYASTDPTDPEALERLIERLESDLCLFLKELQAAATALMRAGGGQIWVLTQEDSAQFYMPMDIAPVGSRARMAAVKSLAKEVARFGIKVNVLSIQTFVEQHPAQTWQSAKEGLKAYALKFKPIDADAVAQVILSLSHCAALPINGMVLPIGIGMPEFNI